MKKILLAFDGSPEARAALETAADLASRLHIPIGVVSVVPVFPGVDLPPQDGDLVRERLQEAHKRLSALDLTPHLHEAEGAPAEEIELVAVQHGYDTIVVGSRDLGTIGRLLQGSVSGHVASHARATVVVVRPGTAADATR